MIKIGLIDYGAGNLGSVRNAFGFLGYEVCLAQSADSLSSFDKLVLPGVGAFGDVMQIIKDKGFDEAMRDYAKSGRYLLGICLGMQLLFEKSYEFGEHNGLWVFKRRGCAFCSCAKDSAHRLESMLFYTKWRATQAFGAAKKW